MSFSRVQAVSAPADLFESKIRPVLVEHCYECHSAEAKKIKGGLRVDSRPALLQGGDTGPAIMPGKPEESLLLRAMAHREPDLEMPPKKPRLPQAVLDDFANWIRSGAEWPEGVVTVAKAGSFDLDARKQKQPWLWQAPKPQALPEVKDHQWPVTPEDRFILARLEEAGLKPAMPADARTWLRRVHFVITGLPPSRDEIHRFLADARSDARERVVDDLLASPHFGERWARHWMDLVRYAESRGHESDFIIANAWHYRNYLIRALNEDVPYSQFVLEHVAGDLLPHPRLRPGTQINESVLATGWAFLGEENHSPVDIRGDECERIDNKVDVFSKTFLGLTVGCARCHDHKFDPIKAQDYYALSGFILSSSYRQVRFESMENNRARSEELAELRGKFAPILAQEIAEASSVGVGQITKDVLKARDIALGRAAAEPEKSADGERLSRWVGYLRDSATNAESVLHDLAVRALQPGQGGAVATESFSLPTEGRVIADFTRFGKSAAWKADGPAFGDSPSPAGEIILGETASQPIARIASYGAARRDLFWRGLATAPGNEDDSGKLAATSRAGQMVRTPTFTLGSGKLHYLIKGKTRVYAAVDSHLMIEGPLHAILVKTFDSGAGEGPRWVTHDLSDYKGHRTHIEFGPEGAGELEIVMVVESPAQPKWTPAASFALAENETVEEGAKLFQEAALKACAALARGHVEPQDALMANWIVQHPELLREHAGRESESVRQFIAAQSNIAARVQWTSHTAVALFDGTGVDENVLLRGKPFSPGPLAPRSLPVAFASAKPITCPDSSGRYDLGLQMIDPANPLVARVFVNRVWHHVFGRGIVASVDNLGALGDRPTHPELLDNMAWQFVHEDGWSLKRLLKRLVLSRTFAMSSNPADNATEERDPGNVLLHRMTVRRLEAEIIRDELLAVSGRLAPSLGGAPEPIFLTEFLIGRGRPEKSGPLDGDGRRSVYMAVRRNFLPTFMQTFDSPTPFSTVGRRNVTNVPAQSLALMNDPLFHQQAEVWAQRMMRELPQSDQRSRIEWLFESAYGRLPRAEELSACTDSLDQLAQLDATTTGALAAWTELCHALLNSNEFIYIQ